jgi:Ser/Thr protein kinase RdoA (MazF antagonist)
MTLSQALNNSQLAAFQSEYFEGRRIEIQKAKESSSRNDYYIVTDRQNKYFLKVCRESIDQLEKFNLFIKPFQHLVPLVPTKSGSAHFNFQGVTFFLQPFIDGRDFDSSKDNMVELARILGAINKNFLSEKKIYPRKGYGSLKALLWSANLPSLLQTKYKIDFTKSDFDFVDQLRLRRESLLYQTPHFEHADCHPSNIRVNGSDMTIIDLDSFCSVPEGTALGMLIERMASGAQVANEMYASYTREHPLKLNLSQVLHLSQLETLQRLNYIFNEIQTTGGTNWPNDFKKHLSNLHRIESYLTEIS